MTKHRKLKIKLLIVYLISILPFLIFIFYLFDLWHDTLRIQALRENTDFAKLAAEYVKESFQVGQITSDIIAQNNLYDVIVKDKENGRLILKDIIAKLPSVNSINIMNLDGSSLAFSFDNPKREEEINIQTKPYFQQALNTKKTALSTVIISSFSGKRLIITAVPLLRNNETVAIITATIDLEYLKKVTENVLEKKKHSDGKNTLMLLDDKGQIAFITNQEFLKEEELGLLSDTPYFREASKGKTSPIENQLLPIVNTRVNGVSVPVDHQGWVILRVVPVEELFAPLFMVQNMIWLIIASGLFFAGGLFSFYLRKIRIVY
ncbi:hypothetical protein MUP32_05205 [Candidatus Microgenomates bacterium]|nr:hypothetical protein [Candidatus Microgenomates bacterium]